MLPTEHQEQKALAGWLDDHRLLWCHVPNGENRDTVTGKNLKDAGVKAGVPDILIFTPPPSSPRARGVAIELKRRNRAKVSVSKSQKEWLAALESEGWVTSVAYGAQHAVEILRSLGYGSPEARAAG